MSEQSHPPTRNGQSAGVHLSANMKEKQLSWPRTQGTTSDQDSLNESLAKQDALTPEDQFFAKFGLSGLGAIDAKIEEQNGNYNGEL